MYAYTIAVLSLGFVFSVIGNPVVIPHDGDEFEQDFKKYKNAIAESSECADHDAADNKHPRPPTIPRPSPVSVMALFEDDKYLTLACSKYAYPIQAAVCSVLLNQLNTTCNSKTYKTTMKDLFTTLNFVTKPFENDIETKMCDSAFKDPVFQGDLHPSCEICNVGLPVRVACIILWQMNIAAGTTTYSSASASNTASENSPTNHNQGTNTGSSTANTKDKTDDTDIDHDGDTAGEDAAEHGNKITPPEAPVENTDGSKFTPPEAPVENTDGSKFTPPEAPVENTDGSKFTPPEAPVENTDGSKFTHPEAPVENTDGSKFTPPEAPGADTDGKQDDNDALPPAVDHNQDKTGGDDHRNLSDDVAGGDAEEHGNKITSPEGPGETTNEKKDDKDDPTSKKTGGANQDNTGGGGQGNPNEVDNKSDVTKNSKFDTSSLLTSPLCQSGPMLAFYKDGMYQYSPISPFNKACQLTTDPTYIEVCKSAMDGLEEFCFDNDKYSSVVTDVGKWIALDPTRPVEDEEGLCQSAFRKIPGSKPTCGMCSSIQSLMRPVCYMLSYLNFYMPLATVSEPDQEKKENVGYEQEGDQYGNRVPDKGTGGGTTNDEYELVPDQEKKENVGYEQEGDQYRNRVSDKGTGGGTTNDEYVPGQGKNENVGDEQEGGQLGDRVPDEGTGGGTTNDEYEPDQEKKENVGYEQEGDQQGGRVPDEGTGGGTTNDENDGGASFIRINEPGQESSFVLESDDDSEEKNNRPVQQNFLKESDDDSEEKNNRPVQQNFLKESDDDSEEKNNRPVQQNFMKDALNENTYNRNFKEEESSSHFLAFSLTAIILILATYIAYHNKHKIIAVIIEGRSGKNGGRRGGSYRRLNQNVSDAMPTLKA